MRSPLICHLSPETETIYWARFSTAGDLVEFGEHALIACSGLAVTTVLVPSESILLTQTRVPTRQRQRLLQAVPYALEEQLAADVETLHFALAPQINTDDYVAVAVVADAYIQHWQTLLQSLDGTVTRLVPDVFAVPYPTEGWGIALMGERVLVRTGAYSGFAIELSNFALCLALALTEAEVQPPRCFTVYYQHETDIGVQAALTILHGTGMPLQQQVQPRGLAAIWAQGLDCVQPLNLLQGRYRPVSGYNLTWRPWRLSLALSLACGIAFACVQFIEYQQQLRYREALSQRIEAVYRETFPKAQRVVSPRVQMEQQLRQLQGGQAGAAAQANVLQTLAKISTPLAQTAGLVLKRLEYRAQVLELNLELASLQALEQLKIQLQQVGMAVEIQSASSLNNRVETRLTIALK